MGSEMCIRDSGTAGPVFLAGTKLASRSFGQLPSLTDLEGGDLKHGVDFRAVYSAVLSQWLGFNPLSDERFSKLKLV